MLEMITNDKEFQDLITSDSVFIITLNRADYYRVQKFINSWLGYLDFSFYQDLKNYIDRLDDIKNQRLIVSFMPPFIKEIFDKGFNVFMVEDNKVHRMNLDECRKYFDI